MTEEFTEGEVLVFVDHYDLFGLDMFEKECMFYKHTADEKCLVYCDENEEWAEPTMSILKQKKPGHVPFKYANMCNRIKELEYSY